MPAPVETNNVPRPTTCIICGTVQRRLFRRGNHAYDRCKRCGLVSGNPIPSASEIERHYAMKFARGNYHLRRQYETQYEQVFQGFVDILGGLLDYSTTPRILDIGCFTGDLPVLLERAGADVYGLELQPEAVAIANEKLPGRIFQADVHGDAFPADRYDAITMTGLIEHVTDPLLLLSRCHGLLKPGAVLLLETPNGGSLLAKAMRSLWPPYAPVEHIHLFSANSIRVALKQTGFEDIVVIPHWKKLPIAYVYGMMADFGPGLRKLITPLYRMLPRQLMSSSLPFYVGEMIVTARSSSDA